MNPQDTPVVKDDVIKKLNRVPSELMQLVSSFLDSLIENNEKAPEETTDTKNDESSVREGLSVITAWDEWFDTVQKLPEVPSLSNLSKQERREMITEALVKKYKRKGLDFPYEAQ